MSRYYNIKGFKVRVSDHEPNTRLNGSCDAYIYSVDACGSRIPIYPQLERISEKHDIPMSSFQKLMDDCIIFRWSADILDADGYDIETLTGEDFYEDEEQAREEISRYLYKVIATSRDGAEEFDLWVEEINLLTLENN